MGSERRSKRRRSSSRSPSPSPSRDDDDRRRNHKKRDEGERKSRKDDSREKKDRKSDKSRERSRGREEKDKKSKKKRKDLDSFEQLSKDDYFAKNNEFSTWLKEEKDIYFSDLSSDKARELFSSFIKAWNKGKLKSRYYEGIVTGPRTAHNWKIKSQK